MQDYLNGRQSSDYVSKQKCTSTGCKYNAKFGAPGSLNAEVCHKHSTSEMVDKTVNERLLPHVFGRKLFGSVCQVPRAVRYICSMSKAIVFGGCQRLPERLASLTRTQLRTPAADTASSRRECRTSLTSSTRARCF